MRDGARVCIKNGKCTRCVGVGDDGAGVDNRHGADFFIAWSVCVSVKDCHVVACGCGVFGELREMGEEIAVTVQCDFAKVMARKSKIGVVRVSVVCHGGFVGVVVAPYGKGWEVCCGELCDGKWCTVITKTKDMADVVRGDFCECPCEGALVVVDVGEESNFHRCDGDNLIAIVVCAIGIHNGARDCADGAVTDAMRIDAGDGEDVLCRSGDEYFVGGA